MNKERVEQALEHVRLQFGNLLGFVATQQTTRNGETGEDDMSQMMVRLDSDLGERFAAMDENGAFVSLNSFAKFNRRASSLWYLHANYIDIDCEKLGLAPEDVLTTLERDYFGKTLPTPTYVLLSGRGVWLVWTLLPRRNDRRGRSVQRWKRVQAFFIDTLKAFGADPSCNDVTRTCRLAGSVNQKNGADVRLKAYQAEGRYSLTDLLDFADASAYGDETTPTPVEPKVAAPEPIVDVRSLILTDDEEEAPRRS